MNYNSYRTNSSNMPDVIFLLLIANSLAFALQILLPGVFERYFALWPIDSYRNYFSVWQLFTYGFLHGDFYHILFNMFMLWMFGRELAVIMGAQRFFFYYITCVMGAGIIQLAIAGIEGLYYPTLGASGGVFGLLLAFGLAFPNRMVMLMFPPIPMKAKYLVILAGAMELYFGVSGSAPDIANFAHLGGMLFGFFLLKYWGVIRF
ncbi:MAG: rhomboid family intramembrane serine protease [Woeseiaceae bacterium]